MRLMLGRSAVLRFLLVLVAVVLIASCGGSDAETAGDSTSNARESSETTTEADAAAASSPESSGTKGLDDYLGTAANFVRATGGGRGGAFGGDSDQLLEEQRLIEQEIQVCMQAQGFTYVPEAVDDGLQSFLRAENEGVSPEEYAETEGFGISTRFDAILDGEVDLGDESDPNQDHLATLSEGEADAWQLALRGQPPERNDQGQIIDPETGEVVQGGRGQGATGGCTAEAQTAVRGDVSALGDLRSEFEELDERIESDPRVAEIRRSWVDCMAAEGFDYTDEEEARAEIQAELRPFLRSLFAAGGAAQQQDGAQGQGDAGQGGGNRLQDVAGLQLTPEQDAELAALQDRERAVAVASLVCQGDTGAEIEAITAAYEAEFVEANREALEAFGA